MFVSFDEVVDDTFDFDKEIYDIVYSSTQSRKNLSNVNMDRMVIPTLLPQTKPAHSFLHTTTEEGDGIDLDYLSDEEREEEEEGRRRWG